MDYRGHDGHVVQRRRGFLRVTGSPGAGCLPIPHSHVAVAQVLKWLSWNDLQNLPTFPGPMGQPAVEEARGSRHIPEPPWQHPGALEKSQPGAVPATCILVPTLWPLWNLTDFSSMCA